MNVLTVGDLAALFGTTADRVERANRDLIQSLDLRYAVIEGDARDAILLEAIRRIHSPSLAAAGEHRADDWESGWRENLDEFIKSGHDPKALVPKYVKPGVPVRLNRRFIRPVLPDFVYHYTRLFRSWLFGEYLVGRPAVYEFGCGTGHNLVHLASLSPATDLVGLDWAPASQELLSLIGQQLGVRIRGRRFDFFRPDPEVAIADGAAVMTFGALEQIGDRHGPYLQFLLARKPSVCVDVVGIHEFYDAAHLVDYLALLYHRRRNYLDGYLTALRRLEGEGAIEILHTHHHLFGNPFDDPYSYVVWRPR